MRCAIESSHCRSLFLVSRSQPLDDRVALLITVAQQLPVPELMEAAKLAGVPLHQEHQTLLFQTPYANRYASTWDQETPRSAYGLECSPRSVKWRAFEAALQHGRMIPQSVEAQLQKYAATDAHRSQLALSPIGPCLDRYN